MVSGLDLLHADSVTVPLSTGLATLDNLLGGGLRHEIVELAGAPQSGKTQLIFTIIANLLRRDPSAEVFLITAAPPVQVVQQLRQLLVTKDLLERVRIEHVARIPELWSLLIDPFWKLDGTRTDQAPSAPLLCIDGMFTLLAQDISTFFPLFRDYRRNVHFICTKYDAERPELSCVVEDVNGHHKAFTQNKPIPRGVVHQPSGPATGRGLKTETRLGKGMDVRGRHQTSARLFGRRGAPRGPHQVTNR
eukprot:GEMP01072135.1.p1 GENE.GEMP01072135.1~~GEMP01072135.1.p1  ORF type:complete len:248 (+),score=33.66 GEMP01072135.1:196-939(+)